MWITTGEEAPRHFSIVGCVGVCVWVCVAGRRVLFNTLARLRKEENLNLTSVLSLEFKKKIILYLILLHIFRGKPNNLRWCLNAPFEGILRECWRCDRIAVVIAEAWFQL